MLSRSKESVDFSIVIPTYNRSKYLKLSILSALRQKGVSFEIIVSDDASTDDTEKVVKTFRDKRIKYWKNRVRLGTAMNFQRCFLRSYGKYIFTLGDDDFILDEHTLSDVLRVMRKYNLGMGKIGTITYETSPMHPYQVLVLSDKFLVLKPINTKDILTKSIDFGLGFFSGLIFNNVKLDKKLLQLNHICHADHMCPIERTAAYDLIKRFGIAYIPNHFIVSRLSLQLIPRYFNLETSGWFFMEKPILLAKKFLEGEEYENFKKTYLRTQAILLPNIKYFTNNKNYKGVLQKMIQIDRSLARDPQFFLWAMLGFMPNFLIKIMRDIKIHLSRREINILLDKEEYFKKIKKLWI